MVLLKQPYLGSSFNNMVYKKPASPVKQAMVLNWKMLIKKLQKHSRENCIPTRQKLCISVVDYSVPKRHLGLLQRSFMMTTFHGNRRYLLLRYFKMVCQVHFHLHCGIFTCQLNLKTNEMKNIAAVIQKLQATIYSMDL